MRDLRHLEGPWKQDAKCVYYGRGMKSYSSVSDLVYWLCYVPMFVASILIHAKLRYSFIVSKARNSVRG